MLQFKVRKNVFETNSSSMHSIAVAKKGLGRVMTLAEAMAEDEDMKVEDGVLVIGSEGELEFGWGFEIIDTVYGRIKYAVASYGEEDLEDVVSAVHSLFPEITAIRLPKSEWGQKETTAGYVDHESVGTLSHYLRTYGMELADYISDRNVLVIIDNDNTWHFGSIVYAGITSESSIEAGSDILKEY